MLNIFCFSYSFLFFTFRAFCLIQVFHLLIRRSGKTPCYDDQAVTRFVPMNTYLAIKVFERHTAAQWSRSQIKLVIQHSCWYLFLLWNSEPFEAWIETERERLGEGHETNNLARQLRARMLSRAWAMLISVGVRRKSITARKEKWDTSFQGQKEHHFLQW